MWMDESMLCQTMLMYPRSFFKGTPTGKLLLWLFRCVEREGGDYSVNNSQLHHAVSFKQRRFVKQVLLNMHLLRLMPELPLAGTVPVAVTLALGEVWECVDTCCGVAGTESSLVWWWAVWTLLGFGSTVLGLSMLSYSSTGLCMSHSSGAFVPHLTCFCW